MPSKKCPHLVRELHVAGHVQHGVLGSRAGHDLACVYVLRLRCHGDSSPSLRGRGGRLAPPRRPQGDSVRGRLPAREGPKDQRSGRSRAFEAASTRSWGEKRSPRGLDGGTRGSLTTKRGGGWERNANARPGAPYPPSRSTIGEIDRVRSETQGVRAVICDAPGGGRGASRVPATRTLTWKDWPRSGPAAAPWRRASTISLKTASRMRRKP